MKEVSMKGLYYKHKKNIVMHLSSLSTIVPLWSSENSFIIYHFWTKLKL